MMTKKRLDLFSLSSEEMQNDHNNFKRNTPLNQHEFNQILYSQQSTETLSCVFTDIYCFSSVLSSWSTYSYLFNCLICYSSQTCFLFYYYQYSYFPLLVLLLLVSSSHALFNPIKSMNLYPPTNDFCSMQTECFVFFASITKTITSLKKKILLYYKEQQK